MPGKGYHTTYFCVKVTEATQRRKAYYASRFQDFSLTWPGGHVDGRGWRQGHVAGFFTSQWIGKLLLQPGLPLLKSPWSSEAMQHGGTYNPALQRQCYKSEATLVYIRRSRLAGVQNESLSQYKTQTNKQANKTSPTRWQSNLNHEPVETFQTLTISFLTIS